MRLRDYIQLALPSRAVLKAQLAQWAGVVAIAAGFVWPWFGLALILGLLAWLIITVV